MRRRDLLQTGAGVGLGIGTGVGAVPIGSATRVTRGSHSESTEPYEPLARLELDAAFEAVMGEDGQVTYLATGDGFVSVDVSDPADPRILTRVRDVLANRDGGPLHLVWDLSVDGDELILVGPAHRRDGAFRAVAQFDISDPAAPVFTRAVETDYTIHNGHLADGYAYLTATDGRQNPLVIVDLQSGSEIARWSVRDYDDRWSEVDPSLYPIHDVHVTGDIAYVSYWDAGVQLVDISDPTAPTHLSTVGGQDPADLRGLARSAVNLQATTPPGNAHYAAPGEQGELLAVNHEAWAATDGSDLVGAPGGLDLFDISDPRAPRHHATIDPPESSDPTRQGVWTSSHNFELRGDRLYSSWYEGGVRVYDIASPGSPQQIADWRDPETASFWTARAGVTDEFYIASSTGYRAEPALFVFPDRAGEQPDQPSLIASTDGTTDGDRTAEETAQSGATSSAATDGSPPDDATVSDDSVSDSALGFGVGTGVAALGGAAWWLRSRLGTDDT